MLQMKSMVKQAEQHAADANEKVRVLQASIAQHTRDIGELEASCKVNNTIAIFSAVRLSGDVMSCFCACTTAQSRRL